MILIATPCGAQSFDSFLNEVNGAASSERQALVNSFVSSNPTSPLYPTDTTAVVYYTGTGSSVSVAGDFNGWNANSSPLTRIEQTNFWFRRLSFEPDARLDYKIIRNGSDWILDPRNPARVAGGFGPNSELSMPAYRQPIEIVNDNSVPKGSLETLSFESAVMGGSRTLVVYTPPNYDAAADLSYPVILYHDGTDYVNLADVPTILDNLIASSQIQPIVALFLKPNNRETEYASTQKAAFTAMVVDELMPWARAQYRITSNPTQTAVTGASLGGLISTEQCHRNPTIFGLCGPFSPSYWYANRALLNEIAAANPTNVRYYVDWGTYEGSIATDGPAFVGTLTEKGNAVKFNEWHEGHSWGSWRAHQDDMLTYFFPGTNATSRSSLPYASSINLAANYPNPFHPTTTIPFETRGFGRVSIAVFDTLGRKVASLVDTSLEAGHHEVAFKADQLPAGVYVVQLISSGQEQVRTMTLIR